MKVKVNLLNEDAKIPQYAYKGDSGFDLSAIMDHVIAPKSTSKIHTGLSFQIPEGYEIQIRPRSGTSLKTPIRIANSPATLDSNFLGEVCIIVDNRSDDYLVINKGDRIAQGVLCPVITAEFSTEEFDKVSDRGDKGFGSSGK